MAKPLDITGLHANWRPSTTFLKFFQKKLKKSAFPAFWTENADSSILFLRVESTQIDYSPWDT